MYDFEFVKPSSIAEAAKALAADGAQKLDALQNRMVQQRLRYVTNQAYWRCIPEYPPAHPVPTVDA